MSGPATAVGCSSSHFGYKSPGCVRINVQLDKRTVNLDVNLNTTVRDFKKMIGAENIALCFQGEILEDYRLLKDYSMETGSSIFQRSDDVKETPKFCGFGFEFNELSEPKLINFGKNGPTYRTVVPGLNLRGTCENSACAAFEDVIWIPIGMGEFHIEELAFDSNCPLCRKTASKIENLGLWNCKYWVRGHQTQPESKKVDDRDKIACKEKVTTFSDKKALAVWSFLKIITEPLEA